MFSERFDDEHKCVLSYTKSTLKRQYLLQACKIGCLNLWVPSIECLYPCDCIYYMPCPIFQVSYHVVTDAPAEQISFDASKLWSCLVRCAMPRCVTSVLSFFNRRRSQQRTTTTRRKPPLLLPPPRPLHPPPTRPLLNNHQAAESPKVSFYNQDRMFVR